MEKICGICGDTGFTELIKTCCLCNKMREHIYCMRKLLTPFPEIWCCEECSALYQKDPEMQVTCKTVNIGKHSNVNVEKAITPYRSKLTMETSKVEFAPLEESISSTAEDVPITHPRCDHVPLVNTKAKMSNAQVSKKDILKPKRKSRTCNIEKAQQASLLKIDVKDEDFEALNSSSLSLLQPSSPGVNLSSARSNIAIRHDPNDDKDMEKEVTSLPCPRIMLELFDESKRRDTLSKQIRSRGSYCIIDTALGQIRSMEHINACMSMCSDSQVMRHDCGDMDFQSTSITDPDMEHPDRPFSRTCWK
ncbi:hypothetical protein Cni_G03467 [Canna indica]|uniref:Zinc finger PHD-type domain-containing protein n=1 Tax=Canna indica TaxID=4628 RepID=A0AAQ3Q3J7_9LILI|nr:hypothetical protein Cni_G03467 [Canna indica]